ncbi:MAG: precorrin-8X methylmutase [Spirochaetaceae bacterium]|jgi:precorrin-8X/cobalt-precorrin-8 methylmutase|nr:precorrin-8X methylmutase [Spirochaetaceae bacterium]
MKPLSPEEIEKKSFEIIAEELQKRRQVAAGSAGGLYSERTPAEEAVLRRVIHTTADFDYAETLIFTHDAARIGMDLLHAGTWVITDTQMAMAGINKKVLARYHGQVRCFMADEDVAEAAKARGSTRARAAVDKAALLDRPLIFAVGNAPTALLRLHELILRGRFLPELVIAVPVGFVQVEEAKALFETAAVPSIIARGRKGGSPVAAAIVNALLYNGETPALGIGL